MNKSRVVDEVKLVYRLDNLEVGIIRDGLQSVGARELVNVFDRHMNNEDAQFEVTITIPTGGDDAWSSIE